MESPEALGETLAQKAHNIPDDVKKVLVKRSVDDAKKFLSENDEVTVEKLAYILYRAYVLGAVLDLKTKQNENNE